MDPASAIGVASAAITFLDFTIEVCNLYGQIRIAKDGATRENAGIDAYAKKIREMTEILHHRKATATDAQLGQNINTAVMDSIATSTALIDLLDRVRKPQNSGTTDSVKALYKALRYREAIQALQRKAEKSRLLVDEGIAQANWQVSLEMLNVGDNGPD